MLFAWGLSNIIVPRKIAHVDGVSFSLSCTNWITHFRWFLIREKEQEVRRYIDQYLGETDTYFDIGANVGVFALYAAKRHQGLKVLCFEPEYSNLNLLKDNVLYNRLENKISIYSVAIGDFFGISNLYLQDTLPGSACHTENLSPLEKTGEGYPVIWKEGIVSITLDQFCDSTGILPNGLKIDTDGNEDKVLHGAKRTLSDKRLRSVIIEMPEDEQKRARCTFLLKESGFVMGWADSRITRNEIWVKGNGSE